MAGRLNSLRVNDVGTRGGRSPNSNLRFAHVCGGGVRDSDTGCALAGVPRGPWGVRVYLAASAIESTGRGFHKSCVPRMVTLSSPAETGIRPRVAKSGRLRALTTLSLPFAFFGFKPGFRGTFLDAIDKYRPR